MGERALGGLALAALGLWIGCGLDSDGTGVFTNSGAGGGPTTTSSTSTGMGGQGPGGTGGIGGTGGTGGAGGAGGSGGTPTPTSCMGQGTGAREIDPDGDLPDPPLTVYCAGDAALVHNSVKYDGAGGGGPTTTEFWNIPFGERLGVKGDPALGTTANYYHGLLYRYGRTYRDEFEDTAGVSSNAVVATVTDFDEAQMKFGSPAFVSGNGVVFAVHFNAGWSAPDADFDTNPTNCATDNLNVTQHYGGCWQYNLGATSTVDLMPDADGGWGPHVLSAILPTLVPPLTPDEPGGAAISRLNRISRWAQW